MTRTAENVEFCAGSQQGDGGSPPMSLTSGECGPTCRCLPPPTIGRETPARRTGDRLRARTRSVRPSQPTTRAELSCAMASRASPRSALFATKRPALPRASSARTGVRCASLEGHWFRRRGGRRQGAPAHKAARWSRNVLAFRAMLSRSYAAGDDRAPRIRSRTPADGGNPDSGNKIRVLQKNRSTPVEGVSKTW